MLLTIYQVYPISPFNFICCGFSSLLPCLLCALPGESTKCFYCSVLSGGILHVGIMLCCCWQWREAERIIPDDRGIKCVAGRWRPELVLLSVFGSAPVQKQSPLRWVGAHRTQSVVPFIKDWGCHTSLGLVSSLNQGFMLCSSLPLVLKTEWLLPLLQNWQIFSVCQCVYNVTYLSHLLKVGKVYVCKGANTEASNPACCGWENVARSCPQDSSSKS